MKELTINSKVTLNNGVEMPIFGLGTYQNISNKHTNQAVIAALEAGYRHLDTAAMYENERRIGKAILETGIPREEIFITTKLWFTFLGYDSALKEFNKSLKKLGTDYVDLYLIHWPGEGDRIGTWKAFEKLLEDGKARAIGVSNYKSSHIDEILNENLTVPAVNQVEFHPFLYQKELLEFCKDKKIYLEAYSPLTQGKKLGDPMLKTIGDKYSKSPAQILIRWVMQHDVIVIPKSSNPNRIKENADVFDFNISEEDMETLDCLNCDDRIGWYPPDY